MQSVSENVGSRFANGQDGFNAIHEVNTMFTTRTPVDRFFLERNEHRAREGLNSEISYLEEKSIYLLNTEKHASEANSFGQSFLRQLLLSPHRFVLRQPTNDGNRLDNRTPFVPGDVARPEERSQHTFQLVAPIAPNFHQRVKKSESHSDLRNRGPKVTVKIHSHLLDQHLLGRPCVNDNYGWMMTPPVNLSADFFHPCFKVRTETVLSKSILQDPSARFPSGDGFVPGDHLPPLNRLEPSQQNFDIDFLANELRDSVFDPIAEVIGHDLPPTNSDNDGGRLHHAVLNGAESIFEPPTVDLESASVARRARDSATVSLDPSVVHPNPTPTCPNILVNVDLEVYSASSADKKVDIEHAGERGIRTNLQARFAAYQRRLENLLALHDNHGFDECMLDFWDEFLPTTSSIHYHDRNTAVPRISCLHKFLTSPCPKAIGVVQCEIERIKVGPKKKGVNMKGRFFPTYEYRLFIHHQTPDMGYGTKPTRRDTVLMMAKNRGRKHVESSTASVPSKKGANNYYLYVPQQEDIEQHFKSVNAPDVDTTSITNGASNFPMPSDGPNLMGRLQSNFIGTEFQIFTQLAKKGQNMKDLQTRFHNTCLKPTTCPSEEDYGYDSAVSSDNPSSSGRHRGRFGRLSLRRSGGGIPLDQTTISEGDTHTTPLRRSRSSGDVNECNRRTRTSRRAIANSSERIDAQRPPSMQLEEEDGAITYTANLLGSRPRIMDVCIPKVSPDGTPGLEWRKYLERCLPDTEGGTRNRMLHHLKQIQQRMENEDHGLIRSNLGGSDPPDSETYSPPEDFGLLALQNRPPWWNIELGSFVLNFGGRVSVASVKNFQLCDRNDQDYIMLQFGRIQGRHSFTMDFQHPLTAVQAFAIAISSLQSKISFG